MERTVDPRTGRSAIRRPGNPAPHALSESEAAREAYSPIEQVVHRSIRREAERQARDHALAHPEEVRAARFAQAEAQNRKQDAAMAEGQRIERELAEQAARDRLGSERQAVVDHLKERF